MKSLLTILLLACVACSSCSTMANQRAMYRPLKSKQATISKAKDSTANSPASTPSH